MRFVLIWIALAALAGPGQSPVRALGTFEAGWRDAWESRQLAGNETVYRVVDEAGGRVLRADANASATALMRQVAVSGTTPGISWRWKVARSLEGNVRELERAGDDYAARLFVIFGEGDLNAETKALCYVWAGTRAVGSIYRSPVVDGVVTIVLQSGDERSGVWVEESRDYAADYREAFDREPEEVAAIALLVDTDDTGRQATAWYDDIVLR